MKCLICNNSNVQLVSKLKVLKLELKKLNRCHSSDLSDRVNEAQRALVIAQNNLQSYPNDSDTIKEEKLSVQKYADLEEIFFFFGECQYSEREFLQAKGSNKLDFPWRLTPICSLEA